ncbi:MAG TPA: hypothetical protein VKV30_02625 [Candidatus Angelobacter sp.]|nr:hypothetical protein [Candidatus Angelobacter sp.]
MSFRGLRAIAVLLLLASPLLTPRRASGQEDYFVTYTHHMEEPGNLEFATKSVTGFPRAGNAFWGNAVEMEYGVKTWWTSELYLDSQTTANESSVFTGFRLENRFRPLLQEHWINPVLYAEFEDINSADKALLEVVGHDGVADFLGRNDRSEKKREVELKLILSSNFKGWNVAENMIAEKNIAGEPWEFGYAVAVSRPLALTASANECRFCRENFALGAELYGGLGDRYTLGLHDTSHYLAPTLAWHPPSGPTFSISPAAGLNSNSHGFLLRFGVSYEINQFVSRLRGK